MNAQNEAKTVADLNLSQEQKEQAAFLLNYRGNALRRPCYSWGPGENFNEFSVEELKHCMEYDEKLTAENPERLKLTQYGQQILDELREKING